MFCNQSGPRYVNPPKPPRRVIPNHPNIVAIFEKTYRVSVKQRDVRSIEEQRANGVLRTGDKRLDTMLDESQQIVYITINDMVELFRNGVDFFLTNEADSKKIFEAVTAHTGEWRSELKYAYNMGDAPVEDLILMEKFVASVYVHARFEFEKRPDFNAATGTLAAFLYSRQALSGTFSRHGELNGSQTKEIRETRTKDMVHTPNIDVFQRALMEKMELDFR